MVGRLRAFAALAENLTLVPSIYMMAPNLCTLTSMDSLASYGLRVIAFTWHTIMCKQNIHTHKETCRIGRNRIG